ncbi:MAG TPA: type II toxin-antitoxin system HicB family antitoxin [Phycisphaerae bacterium]|nr:type II toxin-antitoxin system HicB family antitoxin [Phycisphaerae bacterium]HQL72108.1 type II toxin-antitoxin system HicB family antitoxin [Phycisphaerae bacterium]
MKFVVTLQRDQTGMVVVECPSIPGCVSQGRTEEEALTNIREAIQLGVESRAAAGNPVRVAVREIEVPLQVPPGRLGPERRRE